MTTANTISSGLSAATADMFGGVRRWRLWSALAWQDLLLRYKRSYIGVLWASVSFGAFILVKVLVFGPINGIALDYFVPYVALGFFVWTFVSSILIDSTAVFTTAEGWIKGANLPLSLFVCQSLARNLYLTLFHFLVVILALAIVGFTPGWTALWSIPVFALMLITSFFVHIFVGVVSSRFRDLQHLVQTVIRIMFFLTPIFWLPHQVGDLMKVLKFNPITHFVFAFRMPILDGVVPMTSLYIVIGVTILSGVLAYFALAYARKRLVFWL